MTERQKLILKIMHLAYLIHELTDYCVMVSFSGHVDMLDITVRQSMEDWQTILFEGEIQTAYGRFCKGGYPSDIAELKAKVELLERVLKEKEIPFDEMEYEEEYIRHYRF